MKKYDKHEIFTITFAIVWFLMMLPFIIWFSIELSKYPITKTNCGTTTTGYIINGTKTSCTIELTQNIMTIKEPCGDRSGIVDVNTNCNEGGTPIYSFEPILDDSSEWYWYTSYATLLGLVVFLGTTVSAGCLIIIFCIRCVSNKEEQK